MEENILNIVIDKIRAHYSQVIAIYLFGSFATEMQNQKSDLDLAILLDEKVDNVDLWRVAQEIASAINCDVDLVDLRTSSTVFSFEVLHTGKVIYCRNRFLADVFADSVFSAYLDLNERRASMLSDIKKRGAIYE